MTYGPFPKTVLAQQSVSLGIWPPLVELTIQPEKSASVTYQLTNNSSTELKITPQIFSFEPEGALGEISLNTKGEVKDFFSFISGEKLNTPFVIGVGETKEITLNIAIPRGTPEKDYYYTLLFSNSATEENNTIPQTQSFSSVQLGTNLLLSVSRGCQPPLLGKIVNFSAPTVLDSFSNINFNIVLENWGKTFWKPFGQITLESLIKQKEDIPLLQQNILSDSQRKLTIAPYRPKIPIGPFKARLQFSLNQKGETLNSEIIVWYFPFKLLAVIFIILLIWITVRKIKHRSKSASFKEAPNLSQSVGKMGNHKKGPNQ